MDTSMSAFTRAIYNLPIPLDLSDQRMFERAYIIETQSHYLYRKLGQEINRSSRTRDKNYDLVSSAVLPPPPAHSV